MSCDRNYGIESQKVGVLNNGKMGHLNDIGPEFTKDYSPNQSKINEDGPSEGSGPVRMDGPVNESSSVKIRRIRRGKDSNHKTYLDGKSMDETSVRGGKREVHPTSSNSSGDGRLNKKRKENGDDEGDAVSNMIENMSGLKEIDFEEANKINAFNEGVDNGIQTSNKKRGRKSLNKAKNVARKQGARGLGTTEKGVSDVYKVYHDEGDGKKEPFVFRSTGRADSDSKGCSINMEQVKEIGEIIGVSWAKAEKVNLSEVEIVARGRINSKVRKSVIVKNLI